MHAFQLIVHAMREALTAELDSHVPADRVEADALRSIREFLRAEPQPFSRKTLSGHITGSAIVVHVDGPEILLVRHRKLNRWLQPGGHVHEHDASVLATAIRETQEETGHAAGITPWLDRILHVDVHEIPVRPGEPAHLHYDIRYLLAAARNSPRIPEEEIMQAEWFRELALDALDLDASLKSAIASAMKHLKGWQMADGRW
ncbi:MAG: NUDIX domain-containing protein, partial [Anaerolineae bacterium]|nr:NUDIX domain-containing protein [Gemmatimonadaceae bacterium]